MSIEYDLTQNAHERLGKWYKDTIMRCEVMNLSSKQTAQILMCCLAHVTLNLAQEMGASEDNTINLLRMSWKTLEAEKKSREVRKSP